MAPKVKAKAKPRSKADEEKRLKDLAQETFNHFDVDRNGTMSEAELRDLFNELSPHFTWTDSNCKQLFAASDTNKNGRIEFKEFVDWIFCAQGSHGEAQLDKMLKKALDTISSLLEGVDRGRSSDTAVKEIRKILNQNIGLENLFLAYQELGEKACCCIAEALMTNQTVTYLAWAGNHPGDRGCEAIAKLLETSGTIEIGLENTGLTESNVKVIMDALQSSDYNQASVRW